MLSQATAQRIEHFPVQRLEPNLPNPRTPSDSQIAAIAASLREFQFTPPTFADSQGRKPRRARRED